MIMTTFSSSIYLRFALVAFILVTLLPILIHAAGETEFGYEALDGPTKWATLSPANSLCDTGKQQSPVNFAAQDAKQGLLPNDFALPPLTQFNVSNLKHTIQFTPLDDNTGTKRGMTIAGRRFNLQQFHIHTPSEHRVDRMSYAGEFHLVHMSADNKISVVAMFIQETTNDNPHWSQVLNQLPNNPDTTIILNAMLDTSDMIKATQAGIFTYQGSLTTPPCTEGVTWFVMATPINMSPGQIMSFKKLIGFSARPTMSNTNVASSQTNVANSKLEKPAGKVDDNKKDAANTTTKPNPVTGDGTTTPGSDTDCNQVGDVPPSTPPVTRKTSLKARSPSHMNESNTDHSHNAAFTSRSFSIFLPYAIIIITAFFLML